ncbi:hypothetical protein SARC_00951 [Sphaeroforma arctica JP610]|uniref:Uncharacterized protein n=1 Tax=Sphaeroforma arctica JP610 TaxID=667725 RepID=A0A0L0GDE5_9EUKA|nr:hypothetical protein SARC_00951 [Sphaeroforma arctica JP610]KNC86906.1 hypothetical protein SARC_00951 [Sphaeroforma arctica JP610]|eukprot:XP_014160808.1 hypothetical protein SARC_00951 [Sphaeroforma arctica JP610]
MQFTKPAPIEIRQTDEDNNELKDESDMTIFEDEKISELIDSGMDIVQGFESEDVMSNLAAGQALGTVRLCT